MKFLWIMLLWALPLGAQQNIWPVQGGSALQENKIIPYTNKPLFYMPTGDKPAEVPDDPLYEQKMRLFGTTDILATPQKTTPTPKPENIPIRNNPVFKTTNTFGKVIQPEAVAQSLDARVMITPLSNGTVVVEENQKVIITNPSIFPIFKRLLMKTTPAAILQEATLQINGLPYTLTISETPQSFILTGDYGFQPGIYQISLKYVLQNAWQLTGKKSDIQITLLDHWPFAVNQMSVLILNPFATPLFKTGFLWGKNKVIIDDMLQENVDAFGNLAYQVRTVIPAYTQMMLHLTADKIFTPQTGTVWFIWGALAITIGYIFYSALAFKKQKPVPSIKIIKTIHPVFVAFFLHKDLQKFGETLQTLTQNAPFYRPLVEKISVLTHPVWGKVFLTTQIIRLFARQIGMTALLWGISVMLGVYVAGTGLGLIMICSVMLIGMMVLSYWLWGRIYLDHLLQAIPNTLLAQFQHTYNWRVIKAFYLKTLPLGILFHIDEQMNTLLTQKRHAHKGTE